MINIKQLLSAKLTSEIRKVSKESAEINSKVFRALWGLKDKQGASREGD